MCLDQLRLDGTTRMTLDLLLDLLPPVVTRALLAQSPPAQLFDARDGLPVSPKLTDNT
jgi:hypothetical protein